MHGKSDEKSKKGKIPIISMIFGEGVDRLEDFCMGVVWVVGR